MRERGGEGGQKASLIAERNMQKEICGKKYAERNMPNESKRKGTRPSSFSCLPSLSLSLSSLSLSLPSLSLPSLFFPLSLSSFSLLPSLSLFLLSSSLPPSPLVSRTGPLSSSPFLPLSYVHPHTTKSHTKEKNQHACVYPSTACSCMCVPKYRVSGLGPHQNKTNTKIKTKTCMIAWSRQPLR